MLYTISSQESHVKPKFDILSAWMSSWHCSFSPWANWPKYDPVSFKCNYHSYTSLRNSTAGEQSACQRLYSSQRRSSPGCFLPLSILAILHTDLIQLGEQLMGHVFGILLCAQNELDPLGRCIWWSERMWGRTKRWTVSQKTFANRHNANCFVTKWLLRNLKRQKHNQIYLSTCTHTHTTRWLVPALW